MHRRWTKAILVVGIATAPLWAQRRFNGIPPSVTSVRPGFSGRGFVGGRASFGHNPRFNVFFGNPFFPRRHVFFRGRFFAPVIPYAVAPYYAEPCYPAPYYSAPYDPYAYQAQAPQPVYDTGAQRELANEVEDLRDEVTRLREE